jgi:putative addiction module component (TIGR02574 family)
MGTSLIDPVELTIIGCMTPTAGFDFSHLSPAERLRLVEELWDSLSPEDIPLTNAQELELDRREQLHRENPRRGRPWREILDEIEHRVNSSRL